MDKKSLLSEATEDCSLKQREEGNELNGLYDIDRNPEEVAKEKGRTVIYPKPNELFIDIDNEASMQTYYKNLGIVDKLFGIVCEAISPSPTKMNHVHIVVELNTAITDEQRLFLQACLGSDPT